MFSGYQIRKERNIDELRDIQWTIDNLQGKSLKKIALENDMSISNVKRRIQRIIRKVRNRACNFDEQYNKFFWYQSCAYNDGITKEEGINCMISVLETYRVHVTDALKNGTLYECFKKDIPKVKKNKSRAYCIYCEGKGFFYN